MWKIWLFFSVFKLSFSAPVDPKEDSAAAGDLVGLRCLLLASPFSSCDEIKRHGHNIPKRLQKLYDKVKKPFVELKNDELIDSNSMDLIPTSLLYLIPRIRLQNITGHVAGNILRKSPADEALAIKLSSLLGNDSERQAFLEMLPLELDTPGVHLSSGVEKELGRAMAAWYPVGGDWQYWQFDIALVAGSPVLAYLPSYFLNRMAHPVAEKFVFYLRNWRPDYADITQVWRQHPNEVKRIWMSAALKKLDRPHLWFPALVRYASYLLLGATPDEIPHIISYFNDTSLIIPLLELNFEPLQARVLYDIIEKNFTQNSDVKSVRHSLPHLLPRQIQQFDQATTNIGDYLPTEFDGSLPTKSQILQHRIAHLVSNKKLKNASPSSWKDDIYQLGKLVHFLPSSSLEVLKDEALLMTSISQISSSSLNFRQTRYLTHNSQRLSFEKPETILNAKNHLKALPALKLSEQQKSKIPDLVQRHLLKHVPATSRALSAVLLEKVHLDIDDRPYLTAILENDNYADLLRLLSSRDMAPRFESLVDSLSAIALENKALQLKIRALPSNLGAMLLAGFREQIAGSEDGWTMDNLIESPHSPLLPLLISNLQCTDMEMLNDVDVVPVLGHYVRERRALGLAFPKNMQYCCQKALTRYLKLKSLLRHWSYDSSGLLNLLELFEVRAVGGYILSSLPLDVIQSALLKNHIIREIGSLPLPELLTATSLSNLKVLANLYGRHFRELHLRELSELGNLIWFMDAEEARRIQPENLKLLLEMREPGQTKAPFLTAQEREFWRELLMQTFGKPYTWSSGTLALLGDLLFVFDEADFDTIEASVRVEAADVLAKFTTFHYQVEWPGKLTPITYFEACVEALPEPEQHSYKAAVRTLIRFYLESAQMLANTVIPAETLLRLDEIKTDENNMGIEEVESGEAKKVEENNMALSEENKMAVDAPIDGRIKRAINTKRGRIFKRVLNDDHLSSAEEKKNELLVNGSRALVVVFETDVGDNRTKIMISETFPRKNMEISCDAIRMLGMPASFVIDEEDIKKMTTMQLEDCAEVLGSLNLPQAVRKAIWPRLSKWKENNNLLEVGNLASVIDDDTITVLSFDISKPWTLETLAVLSEHVTNEESLSLIADSFILENPTVVQSLPFSTAAALGRILCVITKSRQQKLLDLPHVFVQYAPLLGTMDIDDYCIRNMIKNAKVAFGPPNGWSAEDVSSLGIIVAGLTKEDWQNSRLKPEALSGLSPLAVSRIPPDVLKELSEEQLSRLPALSVAAISPAQSSSLSPAQSEILERVRRQIPDKDLRAARATNSSYRLKSSVITSWFLAILSVIKFAV